MAASAVLSIRVVSDVAKGIAGLEQVEKKTGRFDRTMRKAAPAAAGIVAGLAALGTQAFDAASAAQQSAGAVEAVYGSHAAGVQKMADQAAQNVGLAKSEYSQMAAVIGSQLKNMGVSQDQLAGQTNDLVTLGADLAAQFGGDTSKAVEALSSLLRGERDPIEAYGVSIKQADIEAKKAQLGLTGLTGEAAKQADTQATLALLTEQTAAAQGAFAREADTAAGAQQRAQAQWQNAAATLGEALLPVVSAASAALASFGMWAQQNAPLVQALAIAIGVLAAGVLAYNAITKAMAIAQGIATAAQWALNAAMTANPIGLIIAAIVALIAIIVLVVTHWDTVKKVALQVWDAIVGAVKAAWNWIKQIAARILAANVELWNRIKAAAGAVWDAIVGFVQRFVQANAQLVARIRDAVVGVWDRIKAAASSVWDAIVGFVQNAIQTQIDLVQGIIDKVRDVFNDVRDTIRNAMEAALSTVRSIIDRIVGVFQRIIDRARSIAGAVSGVFSSIRLPSLPWPFAHPGSDITLAAATSPASVTAAATGPRLNWPTHDPGIRSAGGPTVQITVNGALDPRAVAAQIRDLLNRDARIRGVTDLAGVVIA